MNSESDQALSHSQFFISSTKQMLFYTLDITNALLQISSTKILYHAIYFLCFVVVPGLSSNLASIGLLPRFFFLEFDLVFKVSARCWSLI